MEKLINIRLLNLMFCYFLMDLACFRVKSREKLLLDILGQKGQYAYLG